MALSVIPETGYGRSSSAKGSGGGDVMRRGDFMDILKISKNGDVWGRSDYMRAFDTLSPSANFNTVPSAINPYEQQQSFTASLINGNTRQTTLMGTLFADKTKAGAYTASISGGADGMKRDSSQVIKDGAKVSYQRMGAQADVQDAKKNFKEDFKAARQEALAAFEGVTKELGIDTDMAAETMIGNAGTGKGGAIAYVASETAFGGGTMATAFKAVYVNTEMSKQDKQLPAEDQKRILIAMEERLKSPPAQNQDTRAEVGGIAEAAVAPETSGANWAAMEIDDIQELLLAHPEGEGQPELDALETMEHQLAGVESNHIYAANHYGDHATYAKMEHSANSGNQAMRGIIDGAQVIDDPVVTAGVKDSAPDTALAGDSVAQLSGVKVVASDVNIDARAHSSHFDATLANEYDVRRLLSADMANEFTFGRASA